MLSYPISQITTDDIHILSNNVRKKYSFLTKTQYNYVVVEFFLEQRALMSKQNKIPIHLTCGELIELIVATTVLKSDTTITDEVKTASYNRLYRVYQDTVWPNMRPLAGLPLTDETGIKAIVWESFLQKLSKESSFRLFCISNEKICLKQTLFQDYFISQMTLLALKTIDHNQDRSKLLEYYQYFERLLKAAFKWRLGNNLDENEYKDIISDKIIYLLKEIKEPDFKLTSTLSTYLFSLVKNGVINLLKQKAKYRYIPIEELTQQEHQKYFSQEENNYIHTEEIYTQLVLKECRKASVRTQNIIIMKGRGADYKTISRVLNEKDNNVGVISHRFSRRMREIIRNLEQQ